MSKDTLMQHSIGPNTQQNACKLSHNSIQGHHHSAFGAEYCADKSLLRWSMSVGCFLDPSSPAAQYGAANAFKRPILGCGMLASPGGNTLVISDLHMPYHHIDAFDFLRDLKEYYEYETILNVGDLYDHHAGSYHESEPDAMNPEEEYQAAKEYAKELQEIFPEMIITTGNHDNIPQRKLKTCGLPSSMLSDYNAMYGTHSGWKFVKELWFDSKGAKPMVLPMVLNKRGRWDKNILEI